MRRSLSVLALLLAACLQQAASASVPHHLQIHMRAHTAVHGRRASRNRGASRHNQRSGSAPTAASLRAGHHSRASHANALRRLRQRAALKVAALKTEDPVSDALIDPVPLSRFKMPRAMKGSHDSLVRQNVRAEADGLLRIEDDDALLSLRENKSLIAVPTNPGLRVDERLPQNRRYCRPWTANFLSDLSRVHYQRFQRALQVNSAVRTVAYQRTLGRVNGNAAAADGDIASPHLTGATIDIAKKGLSMQEIGWMRAFLLPLETAGKLDVEEEFHQACFHITVYKSYLPAIDQQVAAKPSTNSPALLATRIK
jgi:Family of unknown function (DUF5715)